MKLTENEDSLANIIHVIIEITQSLRSHPEIKKGPAGRGTLGFFELLRSLGTLNGRHLTKDNIKKAALVTLPHRIAVNSLRPPEEIVEEIIDQIFNKKKVFCINFTGGDTRKPHSLSVGINCVKILRL